MPRSGLKCCQVVIITQIDINFFLKKGLQVQELNNNFIFLHIIKIRAGNSVGLWNTHTYEQQPPF